MMKGGRFISATRNDGCKILLTVPQCAENVIADPAKTATFKSENGTEGNSDDLQNSADDLNNMDTMIAPKDAFSGNYLITFDNCTRKD